MFLRWIGHEGDDVASESAESSTATSQLFAIGSERFVLVDVTQEHENRAEEEIGDGDANVESEETDRIDHPTGDDGSDGVGERVGDVGNGVDASVDGDVANVHHVAHCGQKGRVDESDAETDAANGNHEDPVGAGERDDEAAEALESETESGHHPGVLRVLSGHADCEDDAEDVREESRQPDHAQLPLLDVHRVHHPDGDGGLEEGERHVGHHQSARADGNVRVHEEAPDGRPDSGAVTGTSSRSRGLLRVLLQTDADRR